MNDLDARVAELPKRYEELQKPDAETDTDPKNLIIKALQDKIAELQKPALHEPVTDAEVTHAIGVYLQNRRVPYIRGVSPYTADIRAVLESFLQGRAKPAQEEITDAGIMKICTNCEFKAGCVSHGSCRLEYDAAIRASKGEK